LLNIDIFRKGLRSGTFSIILPILLFLTLGFIVGSCNRSSTEPDTISYKTHKKTIISPVYTMDRKYKSMKGPYSVTKFTLGDTKDVELLWITSMSAKVISEDGKKVLSDEFMCHANLDFTSRKQQLLFRNARRGPYNRLVTLAQGQTEIRLPKGFGIPVLSTTPLELTTQVLNHNETENLPIKVRQKVTTEYIRNRDLDEPLTPLYRQDGAYVLVSMTGESAIFNVSDPLDVHDGASCLPGENAGTDIYKDKYGRLFSGHWVVKPGKEINHTVVTEKMALPYDTKIHAVGVHLHPFAESISLKDLTTNKVIYESRPTQKSSGIGLSSVPYYSDNKGMPLRGDHEYEIISVYNNTSSEDQDAMAVLGLYAIDNDFNPIPQLLEYDE